MATESQNFRLFFSPFPHLSELPNHIHSLIISMNILQTDPSICVKPIFEEFTSITPSFSLSAHKTCNNSVIEIDSS